MAPRFPFGGLSSQLIDLALQEDLSGGDATTDAVFDNAHSSRGALVARETLVLAGLPVFREVFRRIDDTLVVETMSGDGELVGPGTVALLSGSTRSLLRGERIALNFLRHLSGVATLTHRYVSVLGSDCTRLVDTRKTLPGFRELQKYAVRMGGGHNHRLNLAAGIMLKDNHIAAAGSIGEAVRRVRAHAPLLLQIEVECTSLAQVEEALAAAADVILLDNMDTETMREAVRHVAGRARTEASGGITDARLRELRDVGLDIISSGALTHSAPNADLSIDFESEPPPAPRLARVASTPAA